LPTANSTSVVFVAGFDQIDGSHSIASTAYTFDIEAM
jgi:hypothetical protein